MHQLPEGQDLLAGGPTTNQDLSSVVTPGGLTLGEKIRALVVSLVAQAHTKVRDVEESPQISFDKRATTNWNVVTLPNDDGCFTMDGIIPMDAIVDTVAKKVMIGREVAKMMGLPDDDLEPREAYITAASTTGGDQEAS